MQEVGDTTLRELDALAADAHDRADTALTALRSACYDIADLSHAQNWVGRVVSHGEPPSGPPVHVTTDTALRSL